MAATAERVILASASAARAGLLRAAGVEFNAEPAEIDESRLKCEAHEAGHSAIVCAMTLATAKASVISHRHPRALVIGADQILAIGREWFDKPANLLEAGAQLRVLRGRVHELATAACVVRNSVTLWGATSVPELQMRQFSDAFVEAYVAAEGEVLLGSVGAYRLEGRGAQLFSRIAGDHFAVLGLPLIELLEFLRERGVILT
ncbi:MAG TPA: Maf family protein [Stellaceae bacterium]|nr:Maf family protein [Stellaceae bacterium]